MEKILGYKSFNKGLITNQGDKLELNKLYDIKEKPVFRRRGYHMCEYLEDTLRFFDCENIDICKVEGYPEYVEYYDDYNGGGKMYSCQKIVLTKLLTKEEIIEEAKKMDHFRFYNFLAQYELTKEQQEYFIEKFKDDNWILGNIIYHYYDKKIFEKNTESRINLKEVSKQYVKRI